MEMSLYIDLNLSEKNIWTNMNLAFIVARDKSLTRTLDCTELFDNRKARITSFQIEAKSLEDFIRIVFNLRKEENLSF